jgi:RNA polymerase sigma-70 factor (ECF subfamily)
VDEHDQLARQFEQHRGHLRAVAYRMLGSLAEAEDAVQEAWLRLSRSDVSDVGNLAGWLTTVVSRVCLDTLRSRKSRREDFVPDPIVTRDSGPGPEELVVEADAIGLALLVVLETLAPAERLAFVLHDMFDVPFEDIASVLGRTSASTRQLASRARRRVQGAAPASDTDTARRREVVDAFLSASRGGDFEALLAILDPDVVACSDGGVQVASVLRRGAADVASQAVEFARFAQDAHVVLVNGSPGVVSFADGRAISVLSFTIRGGRVVALDVLTDPGRLEALGLIP